MQLFKFSFEESGYIVDEAFVKRSMEKSINKRFLGLFIIAFLDYFFISFLPVIMGIQTIKEYHFINYPLLIAVLIVYLVYIIFSIRHHHRNIYKKYFSSCYLVLTLFILFFSGSIAIIFLIYQKNPIVAILDLILTVGFIINSQIRMFQGIKSSVQKHEKFNSRAYLLSEKIGRILLVVGGSGITALSAIINIRTNGASNEIIDAIIEPFIPLIFYLVLYFIFIEFYKGYYVVKYFEQYRVKFGYSIEEWYGKKSKMYKESLKNK